MLGVAVPEERENNAWTEGVAIWVAVLVVSLVGECACIAAAGGSSAARAAAAGAGAWPAAAAQRPGARASSHGGSCRLASCRGALLAPRLCARLLTRTCPRALRPPPCRPAGAFNDWNKDRQFQKLNAQKDIIEVKVVRGGATLTVPNTELVVGDVMLLDTGDKVVADGYTIEVRWACRGGPLAPGWLAGWLAVAR